MTASSSVAEPSALDWTDVSLSTLLEPLNLMHLRGPLTDEGLLPDEAVLSILSSLERTAQLRALK